MIEVNEELTRKVANLARLDLTDDEVKKFTSQLHDVLGYIDQLTQVDVSTPQGQIEPMTHPLELETLFREDEPRLFGKDEEGTLKILKSAPEVMYDGYKVPPIL